MVVSENALNNIRNISGTEKYNEGVRLYRENRVSLKNIKYTDESNFEVKAVVQDGKSYTVTVKIEADNLVGYTCSHLELDSPKVCSHIVATIVELDQNDVYTHSLRLSDNVKNKLARRKQILLEYEEQQKRNIQIENVKSLLDEFKSKLDEDEKLFNSLKTNSLLTEKPHYDYSSSEKVKVVPSIIIENSNVIVEIKVGNKQLYKVKDLNIFIECIENNEFYDYGAKLKFKHSLENFDVSSLLLIEFIRKYVNYAKESQQIIRKTNSNNIMLTNFEVPLNTMLLTDNMVDELLNLLKGKVVQVNYFDININLDKLDMQLNLEDDKQETFILSTNLEFSEYIETEKYTYYIIDTDMYKLPKNKYLNMLLNKICKKRFGKNGVDYVFDTTNITEFFTVIYPKIKEYLVIDKESDVVKYAPAKLATKIYLDLNMDNDIVATINFVYNDIVFNPYMKQSISISRDLEEEQSVMKHFESAGFFKTSDGKLLLFDEEKTYMFLTGIEEYLEKYEVLVSDRFKTKRIKQAKIGNIGIKVENNLLSLDFNNININLSELKNILEEYALKKTFYKLKDGSFLNMKENKDLETLKELTDTLDIPYKELSTGNIRLPVYRSMYLEKLLESNSDLSVKKDVTYRNLVSDIENCNNLEFNLPTKLNATLREYQQSGFKWLSVLDTYNFGGILADDMGLGKTIQVIALISKYLESNKKSKTSLVVCPSSLILNWKNEINKFTDAGIKVAVVSGKAEEREKIIKNISKYDVLITSYDVLKRDIDIYIDTKYVFKYVIADEAQYIKNSNTQNSKALKLINAETRYALTGTPIENSLSELWSIFDYVLPGYLYTYTKFKKLFETPVIKEGDLNATKRLKQLIAPFILRRIKKDVLTELPDKTISIVENEMENKQLDIYNAHLAMAREELMTELKDSTFNKSQIKILSLINRLRQICCHPSLFLEDYKGQSSKLEQCIELIKEAVSSGHKILLFSSYTSIFSIIKEQLNKEKIAHLELTGKTKINDRIELVDEFNKNKDLQIFLISLKAGGTGLNLTSADIVIHFDPWWNLSAENQATDRAYRIGQKNNVQVYKLITKNSIEEKINKLQETKAKLVDNMITSEETFINKLSKEDILSLFS